MGIMRGPSMSRFLNGLSEGNLGSWGLLLTLALIAGAILVKELGELKARKANRAQEREIEGGD